jgi:hypothetical protein
MSSPVNGVPASNSEDDMRNDLQNIQMQCNQRTDDVSFVLFQATSKLKVHSEVLGTA